MTLKERNLERKKLGLTSIQDVVDYCKKLRSGRASDWDKMKADRYYHDALRSYIRVEKAEDSISEKERELEALKEELQDAETRLGWKLDNYSWMTKPRDYSWMTANPQGKEDN